MNSPAKSSLSSRSDLRGSSIICIRLLGSTTQGLDWLGYRIWPTHKLLRKQSVISAKRKIFKYQASGDDLSLSRFIASWKGHAQWADSFNLLNKLGVA